MRSFIDATVIQQYLASSRRDGQELLPQLVDKLITLGKKGLLAHKRRAFAILCDHKLVSELFDKTAVRFGSRNGGYTRIIKLATNRKGDNAKLVFLELTEREQIALTDDKKTKKKSAKKAEAEESVEKPAVDATIKQRVKKDDTGTKKDKGGGLKKLFRRKTGE